MIRIVFLILFTLIPVSKISAQIVGPNVVEFNDNAIYTEPHIGTPGESGYFWKVVGGVQLEGATQTQVEIKWNQFESGRVEKWLNTFWNEAEILIYELSVTIQNTPSIEYSYDNAGNRIKRQIIILNSTQLKKSAQSNDLNDNKEVIEDRLGELEISIYPNPTEGILSITTIGIDNNFKSSIAIYSISGTLIQKISPIENSNTIDLSSQPEGAYILILTLNNETSEWKIIKQ